MITHVRHRKAVALAATFLCEANLILSYFNKPFFKIIFTECRIRIPKTACQGFW